MITRIGITLTTAKDSDYIVAALRHLAAHFEDDPSSADYHENYMDVVITARTTKMTERNLN